jgi:hypothetical protein
MSTETFPIVPSGAKTFGFVAALLLLILIAVAKVPWAIRGFSCLPP